MDCRFHRVFWKLPWGVSAPHMCHHPAPSLVTGAVEGPVDCSVARKLDGHCGPDGRHYKGEDDA